METSSGSPKRKLAVKLTEHDNRALRLIADNGGIVGFADGEPFLESNSQISPYRFNRLIAFGYLTPNGDAMFAAQSQTYQLRPGEGYAGH